MKSSFQAYPRGRRVRVGCLGVGCYAVRWLRVQCLAAPETPFGAPASSFHLLSLKSTAQELIFKGG